MSSADWEEIKRLASDFEQAQLSTTLQRLSERNCVEIINKLLELKLIEIYPTTDAKGYITPDQVLKEIEDEIFVAGGRIDTTKLSSILNVDFSIIKKKSEELVSQNSSINLVLGQLISEQYLDLIAEEINEKLQQYGAVHIGPLSRDYDLPGKFLQTAITQRLGKIIWGEQDESDPETIFTEGFVARHKYQVRGILSAITKPTSVLSLINSYQLQERLFFQFAEQFIDQGVVDGFLSGTRNSRMAVFTPNVYSRVQYDWSNNFLKQNGYIEYESLKKLGVSDPEQYLRRHFTDLDLTFTKTVSIGKALVDQIETMVEDAIVSSTFVDIYPYVPSTFSLEVCRNLVDLALHNRESSAKSSGYTNPSTCHIFCDSMVISDTLLATASVKLEALMPSKGQELIKSGAFKQKLGNVKVEEQKNKKEERRKKAAGGKAGGGTQGRETKTKSTKKQKTKKQVDDEIKDTSESLFEFLTAEEILEQLQNVEGFEDCPEELLEEVANSLYEPLKHKFQDVAHNAFQSAMFDGGQIRKKNFQQLQESLLAALTSVRLGTKGIKVFDEDLQNQLCKHLIRTQCTTIVDDLVKFLAEDSQINVETEGTFAPETRKKIISKMTDDVKEPLLIVHKILSQNSVDEFLIAAEDALSAAGILIKKKDNKKDRNVLANHRALLLEQLHAADNSALVLHMTCLILFQVETGHLLHASGKFVPQILSFLQSHLTQDFCDLLQEYRDLVMKTLSEPESGVQLRLDELTPQLKSMAVSFKKAKENSVSED